MEAKPKQIQNDLSNIILMFIMSYGNDFFYNRNLLKGLCRNGHIIAYCKNNLDLLKFCHITISPRQ